MDILVEKLQSSLFPVCYANNELTTSYLALANGPLDELLDDAVSCIRGEQYAILRQMTPKRLETNEPWRAIREAMGIIAHRIGMTVRCDNEFCLATSQGTLNRLALALDHMTRVEERYVSPRSYVSQQFDGVQVEILGEGDEASSEASSPTDIYVAHVCPPYAFARCYLGDIRYAEVLEVNYEVKVLNMTSAIRIEGLV